LTIESNEAALLLFGKEENIQSALPHYKIDALLRCDDTERYDDRENIRCNLIEAYDLLMNFIAKHLPDKFYLEGDHRISLRETIFREIIVNLLIHREYTNAHPATLIIYKDRIEAKNPNKPHFYGPLHPGSFSPFPKNPTIAKLFAQMGIAEELGTGIGKVFRYSKAYAGSGNAEFREEDLFFVNLPAPTPPISPITGGITGGITILLQYIQANPGKRANEIALHLNVPPKTAEKHLSKASKAGLIEFRGPKKSGGYYAVARSS
jgi:ATP-dependent DNA helicase RecG